MKDTAHVGGEVDILLQVITHKFKVMLMKHCITVFQQMKLLFHAYETVALFSYCEK